VYSQRNGWQLAQSRDYFCDFGRKLENLSLSIHSDVLPWMAEQGSIESGMTRCCRSRHFEKI